MLSSLNRKERIEVAKETLLISERGSYVAVDGVEVKFDPTPQTEFWSTSKLVTLEKKLRKRVKENPNMQFEYMDESVMDTLFRLQSEGVDMARVGVLNFSNPRRAGDGFQQGSMAQEETLAYCSNLVYTQRGSAYYKHNKKCQDNLFEDVLLSNGVVFFRTSDLLLTSHPIKAMVISAPAPIVKGLKGDALKWAKLLMIVRMQFALNVMYHHGCSVIALGAFGCGYYGFDPDYIARTWERLLLSRPCFDKVIMPVPRRRVGHTRNADAFEFWFEKQNSLRDDDP